MKIKFRWIDIVVLFSAIASFFTIIFGWENIAGGFELLLFFPVVYLFVYIFASTYCRKSDLLYSIIAFFVIQWIRFVLMPAVMAMADNTAPYYSEIQSLAVLLMLIEFIVASGFILLMSFWKINNRDKQQRIFLKGNRYVYLLFACFAAALYLFYLSKGVKLLNFARINVGTDGRIGDITDTRMVLVRQIITCAIAFLFITVACSCSEKYEFTRKRSYLYLSILAAMLLVLVIVGERRSAQIYSSISATYLLVKLFKRHRGLIIRMVLGTAVLVIAVMTIYKVSYAFLYSSYMEALRASSMSMNKLSVTLQSYFCGPRTIAFAIAYSHASSNDIGNMIYDFLRSTAPISFFVKNSGNITSVMFNRYIYGGRQNSGHVLASAAYGYIYGGIAVFPWVMILNLFFAMIAERRLKTTNSSEMTYLWMALFLRFSINIYANTPALLSSASIQLLAYGLVYLGSKAINDGTKRRYRLGNRYHIIWNQRI